MGNQKRAITKWKLYFRTMKLAFILGAILSVLSFIIIFAHISPLEHVEFVFVAGGSALFVFLITVLICSVTPVYYLYLIKKQEDRLSFRFNEEMQRHGINEVPHRSENWFIDARFLSIIAFRKDYILKLEDYIEFINTDQMRSKITVVNLDKQEHSIRALHTIIRDLREWMATKL